MPSCPRCAKEWRKTQEQAAARKSRMAEIKLSNELGQRVCEVLGLDPSLTHRIVIDLPADGAISVTVEMFSVTSMLEIDWATTFAKADIEVKRMSNKDPYAEWAKHTEVAH
jgi:hypothetical protein